MRKLAVLIVIVVLAVPALVYAAPKITGADVVDNSLTGADINESTLVLPPSGVGGREIVHVQEELIWPANQPPQDNSKTVEANCPAGKVATGGSAAPVALNWSGTDELVFLTGDRPTATGWAATWNKSSGVGFEVGITADVYAVCVDG
jgi:hypothetical protein